MGAHQIVLGGLGLLAALAGAHPSPSAPSVPSVAARPSVASPVAPPAPEGLATRIAAALETVDETPRSRREAADALAALGSPALPALLACLAEGLPAPGVGGSEAAPRPLDRTDRSIVLEALARAPRSELAACFRGLDPEPATRPLRVAALEVMAEVAQERDLELLLALAAVPADASPNDPLLLALTEAVSRLLARDSGGFAALQGLVPEAHPVQQAHLLRALARAGGERALGALAHLASFAPRLEGQILREIGLAAESALPPFPEDVLRTVRRLLLEEDPTRRRDAALALGALQDVESLPLLIEELEAEHAGLREAALWALRRITGLSFSGSPARWRSWHAQETRWWEAEQPRLVAELRAGDVPRAASAVRELALHRLYRHEIAAEVMHALEDPLPELRVLAASALGQLESRTAAPALLAALEDEDRAVRDAACAALRAILRDDLPCTGAAWAPLVDPGARPGS